MTEGRVDPNGFKCFMSGLSYCNFLALLRDQLGVVGKLNIFLFCVGWANCIFGCILDTFLALLRDWWVGKLDIFLPHLPLAIKIWQ